MDGVPVTLVVADPAMFGTELFRATGSAAYVEALEPLPSAPTRRASSRDSGFRTARRSSVSWLERRRRPDSSIVPM